MDYDFAARFGELARDAGIVLSVHAPIAGFMGHAERGKKLNMAVGMLDHSAGIAKAAGAEVVVFHPGFLLGRTREEAIDSVVEQLGELRARLEKKDRAVPFGIEVMGRVRELGTRRRRRRDLAPLRLGAAGARLRAHARDLGRRVHSTVEPFAEALAKADAVLEPGAPFHIHFSRHPVREPQRDEAPALRRGHAARRAAARRARAVRAAGDGDLASRPTRSRARRSRRCSLRPATRARRERVRALSPARLRLVVRGRGRAGTSASCSSACSSA